MKIELTQPIAPNRAVNEFDIRQLKKALNRLGYYQPNEKVGITGIPDAGIFSALKEFQKDHGLSITGTVKPEDKTVTVLNEETNKIPDGEYIWRTVEDEKVRASHAEYNRTVRAWEDSPDPGEEFNCRCWAEPVELGLTQVVISPTKQSSYKWTDDDFINHWKHGEGKEVTLPETGWLVDIIYHAKQIMFKRVEKQIEEKAREIQSGEFSDTWERPYDFTEIVYSIGEAVIRGRFNGTVQKRQNVLHIEAIAYYLLDDNFADPTGIRQKLYGSSDPDILADNIAGKTVLYVTEAGNDPYPVTGTWTTKITGSIKSAE